MKIMILGASSMIGHRLWIDLSKHYEVVAVGRKKPQKINLSFLELSDIFQFGEIQALIRDFRPNFVINCLGLIKQIDLSKQYIEAIKINSLLPHELAKICSQGHSKLIHFSTDCVFDGKKGMYHENDIPNESDLYGRTKALGEVTYLQDVLTIRTSFVGRELSYKGGLIEWFFAQTGKQVKGFANAIYSGLSTHQFSEILKNFIFVNPNLNGLYHLASLPINKYDLLSMINTIHGLKIDLLRDDSFYCERSLNCSKFVEATGYRPIHWESMIADFAVDPELYARYS